MPYRVVRRAGCSAYEHVPFRSKIFCTIYCTAWVESFHSLISSGERRTAPYQQIVPLSVASSFRLCLGADGANISSLAGICHVYVSTNVCLRQLVRSYRVPRILGIFSSIQLEENPCRLNFNGDINAVNAIRAVSLKSIVSCATIEQTIVVLLEAYVKMDLLPPILRRVRTIFASRL